MNIFRQLYRKQKFTSCPFCDWPHKKAKLILAKTDNYYLTLNEFPYVEHHLLIAPLKHITTLTGEEPSREKEELTKRAGELYKKLGISNYVVLDRHGSKSGRSLAHIHRHLVPVVGPHDMFYRFADVRSDWDKFTAAREYQKLLEN